MKCQSVHAATLAILLLFQFPTLATAMGGGFEMSFSSGAAAEGGLVPITLTLTHATASGVQGFSFGVCHDLNLLDLEPFGTDPADLDYVIDWSTEIETIKNGEAPDFMQQNIETGGWAVGCVICFTSCAVMDAGSTEIGTAFYRLTGPVGSVTTVGLCNTLGIPPVSSVAVVNGTSNPMTSIDGTIEILEQPPTLFYFTAPYKQVNYDPLDGSANFSATLTITEDPSNATYPSDTQGFSMSLSTNPTYVIPTGAAVTGPVALTNPAFSESILTESGWAIGVVYAFQLPVYIQFPNATDAVNITGSTVPSELAGDEVGVTIPLTWQSHSTPPIFNVVTFGNQSLSPVTYDGSLILHPQSVLDFIRGDANGDGIPDVADVVWSLQEIFNGGPQGTCHDAKDANGDELFDVADPVWLISYIFTNGATPPPPFPNCGNAGEPQNCSIYNGC
jgi:hypothetical protein